MWSDAKKKVKKAEDVSKAKSKVKAKKTPKSKASTTTFKKHIGGGELHRAIRIMLH
jgi:hypothetical protein